MKKSRRTFSIGLKRLLVSDHTLHEGGWIGYEQMSTLVLLLHSIRSKIIIHRALTRPVKPILDLVIVSLS